MKVGSLEAGAWVVVGCAEIGALLVEKVDWADSRTDNASKELDVVAAGALVVDETLTGAFCEGALLAEPGTYAVETLASFTLVVSVETIVIETVVGSGFLASDDFVTVW